MAIDSNIWTACEGHWQGLNRLWLHPGAPVRQSQSKLTVALTGQGRFVTLAYTWADEGQPQDGLLLVGREGTGPAQGVWIDSWHNQDKMMTLPGIMAADGSFSLLGAYAAPPGPDWGWRITVQPQGDELHLTMHNITPDGQEALAVEIVYRRVQ